MIGQDTMVNCRVRLARNYTDLPFDLQKRPNDAERCIQRTVNALELSGLGESFHLLRLREMTASQKEALNEKHLITKDLLRREETAAVLLNENMDLSVMINEEDHLRIMAVLPGRSLIQGEGSCFRIEEALSEHTSFAFDPQLGYLTAYPTNTGTGLRASMVLHLPMLTLDKQMGTMNQMAAKVGLTIRGLYGEGSEALGSLYLVSNNATLGRTEHEIVSTVDAVALQLGQLEQQLRERYFLQQRAKMEDEAGRAWGILRHARLLDVKEFFKLWSSVRVGALAGMLPVDAVSLDAMLENAQAGHLKARIGEDLSDERLLEVRADFVRRVLKEKQQEDV